MLLNNSTEGKDTNMNYVFLFPGQGSQKVGMGRDFNHKFEFAKKRFEEINTILGYDLKTIILEGPESDLVATQNTQPALFTIESIITDLLKEQEISPSVCLGHSLGEYSALYAAGVFSFADGLQIVAKRGKLMAQAGKISPGTMAAIIGLPKYQIDNVLSYIKEGTVVSANENSPQQIVISGDIKAVDMACDDLKKAGAKLCKKLPVSGAFHSPLMEPAAADLAEFLNQIPFRDAHCPVITNVTAKAENKAQILKELLIKQLLSPVRWVESMEWIKENEENLDCLEVGPGKVLQGLAKKCDLSRTVHSCGTVDNFKSLIN